MKGLDAGTVWLDLSDLSHRPPGPEADGWLDDTERQRAERFVSAHDRDRFIHRRALLRKRLAGLTGLPASELVYSVGRHGRLSLASVCGASDVRFSVSSSGPLLLLAFTRGLNLGVDIEEVRAYPELSQMATQVLSSAQQVQLEALAPPQRPDAFFGFWTQMEAHLKMTGEGLAGPGPTEGLIRETVTPCHEMNWRVLNCNQGQRYRVALAVEGWLTRIDWTVPAGVTLVDPHPADPEGRALVQG